MRYCHESILTQNPGGPRAELVHPEREFEMEKEKWKRGGGTNSLLHLSKSKTVIAMRENSGMRTQKLRWMSKMLIQGRIKMPEMVVIKLVQTNGDYTDDWELLKIQLLPIWEKGRTRRKQKGGGTSSIGAD